MSPQEEEYYVTGPRRQQDAWNTERNNTWAAEPRMTASDIDDTVKSNQMSFANKQRMQAANAMMGLSDPSRINKGGRIRGRKSRKSRKSRK
jgi:hypothetical protein